MKLSSIGTSIMNFGKNTMFAAKKKSPELCLIGAVVFGAGALISTFVAARKMDKAFEEPKAIIETAKSMELTETYTEKDQQHDILIGKLKYVGVGIKLFAPAIIFAGGTLACMFGGYKILSNRNFRLLAANGILAKELDSCRKIIDEKLGKDEAYKLMYSDKLVESEETVTDENGEEKTEKVKKAKDGYDRECFGRFFDEACRDWMKDPQHNIRTLRLLLEDLNRKLRIDGILLLNDVYEALDLPKTQAGYSHGWARYPGEDEPYVSFGEWLYDDAAIHRIITTDERIYWLDFNCAPIDFKKIPFRKV